MTNTQGNRGWAEAMVAAILMMLSPAIAATAPSPARKESQRQRAGAGKGSSEAGQKYAPVVV